MIVNGTNRYLLTQTASGSVDGHFDIDISLHLIEETTVRVGSSRLETDVKIQDSVSRPRSSSPDNSNSEKNQLFTLAFG